MRTRTGPVASTMAGTLLALTLLTGCGGGEETTAEEPTQSTEPTASSEPAESTEPTESAQPEDGTSVEAFLDRLKAGMGEEGSVHVDMKMTGPVGASAEGDTTYGPDGSEMRLRMRMSNLPGGAMEMIVVDGDAYMSMPGVTKPGKYFEVDQSNPMFSGLDQGMSPADSFAAFEAGLEQVQELGPETVGGDETTHYRLEVDAAKALEASGQPSVPGLPDTLTYDVWLDPEDRMRRLVYELAGTKLTMDMTDWGKDVTIVAPDKDDIVEAPPKR